MVDKDLVQQIADLFVEAGHAHHQAFIETDGADPDWPLWYADYLHPSLSALLKARFTRSELVYLLVALEKEQSTQAPGADWPHYYARSLAKRYVAD